MLHWILLEVAMEVPELLEVALEVVDLALVQLWVYVQYGAPKPPRYHQDVHFLSP